MAQNNQTQRQSVTTRGYKTYNSAAEKASAFEWDFQDDMVKLITTPELPESQQTEKRRYDYENSWVTCVSRLKCLDLWNKIEETLLPSLNKGEDCFVSVPVAEVNQVGVGVSFNADNKPTLYYKLIRNIDVQTLKSSSSIKYEFRKGEVIVGYNNETGEFKDRIITEAEFLLFVQDLRSFVIASSKAFNHANRVVDRTYKDMISHDIRSIGNKVGAEMQSFGGYQKGGAHYGQGSLFDTSAQPAQTEQLNSLNDLDGLPFD